MDSNHTSLSNFALLCRAAKLTAHQAELNKLDIFNKFFMVARRDHPFTSPLHNRETPRIMDLGCGTGIWGIEVAEYVFCSLVSPQC
jgi:hypothetical protein